jgi:hypothetical protein
MAGILVPVVMIPKYTCYSGIPTGPSATGFVTQPCDVRAYAGFSLNFWRSPMFGTGSPGITVWFEESVDEFPDFTAIGGSHTPNASDENPYTGSFTKQWFRIRVILTGDTPVVTCFCAGFFEQRPT